ncbi:PHD-finger domain-containing protein [Babesia caballi]|uniref:PHD-finger domain-containing protein n=1 Tax=Babesia caballi TaxID=5871 RepID=A0AAV4LT07_BABCB|nr:PHD-finger domain-containing protein [Babesia caballi]
MESEPLPKLPPIYVNKSKRIRTDVLTRQALVPPIFRRREPAKREGRYSKVHSSCSTNDASQPSAHEAHINALYVKYKTDFNYISPELVLNQKFSRCQGLKSLHNDGERDAVAPKNVTRRRRLKDACADFPDSVPTSPWLNRMIPVLLKVIPGKDEGTNDASSTCLKDEVLQMYKSGQKFEEGALREVATVLSKSIAYIDEWRANALDAISQRITIEEARSLMEEFQELSGGLIKVDLATEIDNDIKTCEAFGAKVRMTMTTLSSSADRTVSLEEVESLVQESRNCRFLVPEVVALQSIFRNLISLRSLMERSVLELDLAECESLVSVCEKGLVRLPRLDELRRRLQESVWLHSAAKVCQRQVKYSLAKSLIDNVPAVLREHRLYGIVKQKCLDVEQWLQRISQYSFYQMVSNELTYNGLLTKKDSNSSSSAASSAVTGEKCDARTFEELCTAYHKLDLTLPIYRSIYPLFQSLRRLQKRLHKIGVTLDSNSRNPNVATDCILFLQHSEPLSEIIDLTEILQPIRLGVESWLSYEKKCRRVLDGVKSFTLSKDFNKLKTDWGFLLNFRKTTKLSNAEFIGLTDLMKAYGQEERVSFDEIRQLEADFGPLRIKNLVLQREISEIYEKGLSLISKIESAVANVKEDKSKSGAVLSHVVLVILEVLKFGVKLDSMPKLTLCLEYLRWSRDFYGLVFSGSALSDGGVRLRALATEGVSDSLRNITLCAGVHEKLPAKLKELGWVPPGVMVPSTEFELLRLLLEQPPRHA